MSPLYVDLDGTFIKSDLLYESFVIAIKRNPLVTLLAFFWLLKGKAHLKYQLSKQADIQGALLPLNPDFYDFLLLEKSKSRKIILATASHEKYAKEICDLFDLFDSYICSSESINLKGQVKLDQIRQNSERFSYAGNSHEDFIIFEHCEESYLVNPSRKAKTLARKFSMTKTFDEGNSSWLVWLKQLRVHQWIKNTLIFIPLMVSGSFVEGELIWLSMIGFISFSCLASATYIINDLFDLESDRSHLTKKYRPLAAGNISLMDGKVTALLLLIFTAVLSMVLNQKFGMILILYLLLTLGYSLKIKQYIGLDVITLACLYNLRIMAGAVILDVEVSFWLLSFSMLLFFSLALIKRCAELKALENTHQSLITGRDYREQDYAVLMSTGISSAMMAVVIFCLYINNNVVSNQYQNPLLLWLILPCLCYWLMRMWIKTHRGEMHCDPIVFVVKDKGSVFTVLFMVALALISQLL